MAQEFIRPTVLAVIDTLITIRLTARPKQSESFLLLFLEKEVLPALLA